MVSKVNLQRKENPVCRKIFFLLCLSFLLSLYGHANAAGAKEALMIKEYYVPLVTIDKDGDIASGGSGLVVDHNRVLTCFHLLKYDQYTTYENQKANVIKVDTFHDLALLEFSEANFSKIPTFTKSVEVGEDIYVYSNALLLDGVMTPHNVAKKDKKYIYFFPQLIHGASGAGVFNHNGEVIGIFKGSRQDEDNQGLGAAIPAKIIIKFLK